MKDKDETNTEKQRRNELLLAAVLLGLATVCGGGYYWGHRELAQTAEVTVDGQLVETLDLSEDQKITIQGVQNGENLLVVQNGAIWCEEASCPDKVCVHQGKQSRDGEMIVCLPNRMVVKVIGE
ncbi:MAG: NusG domain II-containing protein [Lachnospiraceae bacterium]|jgi:hypothetical protein|nr:NusG domain II-containing protein [Lachnospiraceae bacterium]